MTSVTTEPARRPASSGWCAAALALLMADALGRRSGRTPPDPARTLSRLAA